MNENGKPEIGTMQERQAHKLLFATLAEAQVVKPEGDISMPPGVGARTVVALLAEIPCTSLPVGYARLCRLNPHAPVTTWRPVMGLQLPALPPGVYSQII
jgi:hypothetical protein